MNEEESRDAYLQEQERVYWADRERELGKQIDADYAAFVNDYGEGKTPEQETLDSMFVLTWCLVLSFGLLVALFALVWRRG